MVELPTSLGVRSRASSQRIRAPLFCNNVGPLFKELAHRFEGSVVFWRSERCRARAVRWIWPPFTSKRGGSCGQNGRTFLWGGLLPVL